VGILQRSESRDGARVIWLAVHSTEGNDTMRVDDARSLRDAAWWEGSSHAITDNEVLLTPAQGCVPYELAAWTLRGGNHRSENIEQVGWARWSRAEWLAHPGTLDHTARWLADRSKARGIPLVKLSPADVAAGRSGVIGHVDYTIGTGDGSHTDPGPGYPWDVVIAKARDYAAGVVVTPPEPVIIIEEDDVPIIVNIHSDDNKKNIGYWCKCGIGYHVIARTSTVLAMRGAKFTEIIISLTEHNRWVADQARLAGLDVLTAIREAAEAVEADLADEEPAT
jgi:hypothetical protein